MIPIGLICCNFAFMQKSSDTCIQRGTDGEGLAIILHNGIHPYTYVAPLLFNNILSLIHERLASPCIAHAGMP